MSKLFYKQDAGWDWNKALPVGNGKLGAMIYGTTDSERIQLNEDSLWHGGPMNRINQDAFPNLEKVRNLIFEGKIPEAEELLVHAFSGTPENERPYSTLGELNIRYNNVYGQTCRDYERSLDLERGVHSVRKTYSNVTYREEIFANAPSNVLVIKIDTEEDIPFDIAVNYSRGPFYDTSFHDENTVYFMGQLVGDNYSYTAGVSAFSLGGSVEASGGFLLCKQVSKLCIVFTAATTFRESSPLDYVRQTLNAALHKNYAELYEEHLADYLKLFATTKLNLEYDKDLDLLPTDQRLARFDAEHPDNGLISTYFDFGRYLLISCSRPGSLPANLQGIWNPHMDPPWGGKYTVNINTEMNYWPAEMLGLSECHLPLFDHMKRMAENGRNTAREMYGCRGTVCHHNTDLWGDTAPQDIWIPATYWVMSFPWLCTHVWEHYQFTKNREFLEDMYPVMKDVVLFFHDFLVEKDGVACIVPSVSPENTYILPSGVSGSVCYNSTMDVEILRDLFTQFIAASEIVGDDDTEFVEHTKELLSKLPPIRVGKYGQVMEWVEDYEEKEPGHRHISHLYALHPSSQITVDQTPELCDAARMTLARRLSNGGGHTGWSRAWIMNMFARLWDGEKTYENLVALLKRSTLDNLFDNHPPFQIDGNFGSIAAIGEMLLQSNAGRVVLLPALPKEWETGSICGIKVRGGASFNLYWKNGVLSRFSVSAEACDYHTVVYYGEKTFKLDMSKGEVAKFEIY